MLKFAVRVLLCAFILMTVSRSVSAQVVIRVGFGPPAIPVYEQPICPDDGYLWTPGYWAYDDDDGYYWVPGTWVEAPQPGYLWTPGFWGWESAAFIWHEGYWGEHVGFYGGINYGFGYNGFGYEGGRWENNHFFYNTYVNHVNVTIIHNTYNTRIEERTTSRVAFNGGEGGINARPSAEEQRYASERHIDRVPAQQEHLQQARANPQLRASANQGRPPIAATAKAGDFHSGAVPARQAGGEYHAPPANAARGNQAGAGENRPPANNPTHAKELQPHQYTPPNTGNVANDKKYQQQQQNLAAKQNQDHQKLQQRQDKEDQQVAKRNNDAQKQQVEQRHAQQTQQLEQRHTTQQQQMQQRQQPKPEARPEGKPH